MPAGNETVIGEDGASLSGGERRRLFIVRAIMKDVPVIFPDQTAAPVDPGNENELMPPWKR